MAAEDQFNMATEIEPSWGDIDFVKVKAEPIGCLCGLLDLVAEVC